MSGTGVEVVLAQLRGRAAADEAREVPDRQLLERFTAGRDEAAFAALVGRHGPLVWGVCRRVLGEGPDAEDAFQAAFVVLARKAGSVGRTGALGGFLHRVAYHAALKARARSADRMRHERKAAVHSAPDPLTDVTGRELLAVLDEELARLPERYRVPLVLCHLEGKTCDEAARHLGWSVRTLKRRLTQGRGRLRTRLTRRGLAVPAALLAAGSVPGASAEAAPAALTAATVQAGVRAVPGTAVAALAAGVLRSMTLAKIQSAAALVMAAAVAAVGAFALVHTGQQPPVRGEAPGAPRPPEANGKPAVAADTETMTISGRVLDAGKPVAGAEVATVARGFDFAAAGYRVLTKGSADGEGRFRLTVPRPAGGECFLLVGKPGYGLVQRPLGGEARRREMTLTLPPEQPVHGRLLDLQGEPVAGAVVAVMRVGTRDDPGLWSPLEVLPLWPSPATSDAAGRFTIAGLPRGQEAVLQVRGDRFGWQTLPLPADNGGREKTWTLSPGRVLEGKVVCADTGAPAANVRVTLRPADVTTRTDAGGRFRLGMPAVNERAMPPLQVFPARGEPYLAVRQEFAVPRGKLAQQVEVKLPRGVLVRGWVTEAGSGRPVAGAGVQYVPREADNPKLRPELLTGWNHVVASSADGGFEIAVPPGPGHLLISGPGLDFVHQEVGENVLRSGKPGGYCVHADALVRIDPAPGAGPKEVAVELRRGVTVRGRLVGPDGKPVARAVMICGALRTAVPSFSHVEVLDSQFALHGLDPAREYPVSFLDAEHGLGAAVVLKGKQAGGDPMVVRLAPCGKAVVRFVDREEKPLADRAMWKSAMLQLVVTPGPPPEEAARKGVLEADIEFADNLLDRKPRVAGRGLRTDAEGRFTYTGLIPGATYRLTMMEREAGIVVKKEFRAEAGKTLELGGVAYLSAR
jgi:RNA polymerase sigma factor (sigma-70 family)